MDGNLLPDFPGFEQISLGSILLGWRGFMVEVKAWNEVKLGSG